METLNKKTLSFSARLFTRAIAALALVTSVAACGNNGGGGVTGPQLGTTGIVTLNNCATCTSSMGSTLAIDIFNARDARGIALLQNMQLIVSGYNFVPGVSSSYNLYNGPMATQGTFVVTQTTFDPATGQCVIPAGSYVIQTAEVGQMFSPGLFRVPTLVSTTGNIVLEVREGVLYKDMMTQSTRMYGSLFVKSVNGQVCTNAFSFSF